LTEGSGFVQIITDPDPGGPKLKKGKAENLDPAGIGQQDGGREEGQDRAEIRQRPDRFTCPLLINASEMISNPKPPPLPTTRAKCSHSNN